MNKKFLKELKALAKKYNYALFDNCVTCGASVCGDMMKTSDDKYKMVSHCHFTIAIDEKD